MTSQAGFGSNPFSTRFVRPGALPYCFPQSESAARMVGRLRAHGWRGQIVGAHGSGKTTLLHALAAELRRHGRQLVWVTLHSGQRNLLAQIWKSTPSWHAATQVLVDGYEQLGLMARSRLFLHCWRQQAGLLITTHRQARMPVLVRTTCPLELVQQLVNELTADAPTSPITPEDVAHCYLAHDGNVRDTFFALYDLFEQSRC